MGRLDTAGFFKNLAFHGHSKKQLIPLDNDDYGNPSDPCDKCPDGYSCDNGECIPVSPGPTPTPGPAPGPIIDPQPIDPENPTEQNQCKRYTSRGDGIRYTENNTWTGYDENSGAHWTFRCAESITFYGRLNHTNTQPGTYLVNDIRWGVGNHVRSFVVPVNDSLEQSIFKFNVKVDGNYIIEIKKKASGDKYYPWEVWEAGKLEDADGLNIYMGVSAGAEIWGETLQFPDEVVVLYEGAGGNIIHNRTKREVTLTKANGDSITIMDRNVGATAYYGESGASADDWYGNYYQWGNNYGFPNTGNVTTRSTTVDTTGYSYNNPYSSNEFFIATEGQYGQLEAADWSDPSNDSLWGGSDYQTTPESHRQGPCPDGWHIPDSDEGRMLLDYWSSITGINRFEGFNVNKLNQFASNTLIPLNGYRSYYDARVIDKERSGDLWTTSITRYEYMGDAARRINLSQYGLFCAPEEEDIDDHREPKVACYGIRPFKNTTT